MMKKLLFTLSLCCSTLAMAQLSMGSSSAHNNWVFGGSVGASFGSNSIFGVSLSPKVGYLVTPDLVLGLTAGYAYWGNRHFSQNTVNVGPFATYYIGRSFYLSTDFREYFLHYKDKDYNLTAKDEEAALFLGAGYMQRVGSRMYFQIGAAYNVLYKKDKSHFSSGFVPRIGIVFGI